LSLDPLDISGMHNGAHPKVFSNAAKLRERMTEPEMKLWKYLKTKPHDFKFRRQHPLGIYILDFYCHKLRISIEIDGDYHLTKEQREKDVSRTAYLMELGIKEYRFTNQEVLENFDDLIEKLQIILRDGFRLRRTWGERRSQKPRS
jgi:very-short-patch-repair endonuclease